MLHSAALHPSYHSARLLAAESDEGAILGGPRPAEPELVIVWDELGAGIGCDIAVSDGGEAAQPFRPELKPVDAYCSAILDKIHIDAAAASQLTPVSPNKT